MMNKKLNEILAQVFNLESADSIRAEDSLIADLGADSLDFVEIIHLIERTFGIVIKTNEILVGASGLSMNDLFSEGRLTANGVILLNSAFPSKRANIREGMTKLEMTSLLTVADLAAIILAKSESGGGHA